ncbi:tetratricopeptide repeat protein [Halalkalibacillus halophilus]|uniref:tetratricopeptide repeat protein n=1 Tax=Halalkalibacillus halophilus TaxID=392827 RepID=UPI000429DC1F|nr:tetratricopeptide repeat protein [Halalkalibacillus halophilus]
MERIQEIIGTRIVDLRKHYKLTQKELCEGICTQAYISKIESGSSMIAADILFQIADRLEVNVSYFYDGIESDRTDYLQEVEHQARKLVYNKDYVQLRSLLKREENSPLRENPRFEQFYLWHSALCKRYIEENYSEALNLLEQALRIRKIKRNFLSKREIKILTNKANIFIDRDNFSEALKLYHEALRYLQLLPEHGDYEMEINLNYNIARLYLLQKDFSHAIEYANEGMAVCKEQDSMYGLGYLLFIIGRVNEEMNNAPAAIKYLTQAKTIFNLSKNDHLVDQVQEKLDDFDSHSSNEDN